MYNLSIVTAGNTEVPKRKCHPLVQPPNKANEMDEGNISSAGPIAELDSFPAKEHNFVPKSEG